MNLEKERILLRAIKSMIPKKMPEEFVNEFTKVLKKEKLKKNASHENR